MAVSFSPDNLRRYADIVRLFIKYGHSDLMKKTGLDDTLEPESTVTLDHDPSTGPKEFAKDLESRGPIYIKLGQVLSSRPDLLPPNYVDALSKLQDRIEPFSFQDVEKIVQDELGVRLSKAFQSFEAVPIASASLGQVHRAVLRDGREVAVKVQRPKIREQIAEDLSALDDIASLLDEHTEIGRQYKFQEILAEFRRTLARELDYLQEARNLQQFDKALAEFPNIVVPLPVEDYTTSHVLTMDFIRGRKITAITPLAQLELNGTELASELFRAYLKQILVDGLFHADPHPGNVFLTDDQRIALIDLGMVGRLGPQMQEKLLRLLMAVSEGRSDAASDIALDIGTRRADRSDTWSEPAFRAQIAQIVAKQQGATLADIQIGSVMLEFTRVAADNGVMMPNELTMLGKTLLNLDEIGRILDPKFDPNEAIRENVYDITRQRMVKAASPGNLLSAAIEAKEFAQELPGRVNRILDALAKNQIKLQVDAIEEETLIEGFQKVSNRITTGLVLAALIIGAAMLMRVDTPFRIFGYPGLAMVCFIAAALGGFALLISIAIQDRNAKLKSRGK